MHSSVSWLRAAGLLAALVLSAACGCSSSGGSGPDDDDPPGETIYVDAAYTGDETGSQSQPFNTIAEALAAAEDGYAIVLAAGSYDVDAEIVVDRVVEIEGAGAGQSMVSHGFAIAALSDDDPVVISGLSCPTVGCFSDSASAPVEVRECHLEALEDSVAIASDGRYFLVKDSAVDGDVCLFRVSTDAPLVVQGCNIGGRVWLSTVSGDTSRVTGCTVGEDLRLTAIASHGLVAFGNDVQSDVKLTAVSCKHEVAWGNTVHGDSLSVVAQSDSVLVVSGNMLPHGDILVKGILFEDVEIEGNQLDDGVISIIGRAMHGTIAGNLVESTIARTGIYARSVAGPSIEGNTIILPYAPPSGLPVESDSLAVCGIRVTAVSSGAIAGNTVEGGAYGIYICTAAAEILDNEVSGAHHGIGIVGVGVPVDGNTVTDCVGDGIVVGVVEDCTTTAIDLSGNSITNNGGAGVRLRGHAILGVSPASHVGGNTLQGNGGFDLVVATAAADVDSIFARYNTWDHTVPADIGQFDIYDSADDPFLSITSFEPIALTREW